MIGRFLEISVYTGDIKESLEFYEQLGFRQSSVGETWEHPYAVLSDGRLVLGLHQSELHSPSLTFVRPQLTEHLSALEAAGIELDFRRTGDEHFNEAGFLDPDGHIIRMLEARTFSPPAFDARNFSLLGRFSEYSLPARDAERSSEFWEPLGFVAAEQGEDPVRHRRLISDGINVGFYETREFREAVLVFRDDDMDSRLDTLRAKGCDLRRGFRDIADAQSSTTLPTPEGTTILLLGEEGL